MLVHGTWGRGFRAHPAPASAPRWFDAGSPFEQRVTEALRERGVRVVSTDRILWSGANSLLHRDAAARVLAGRLDELHEAEPGTMRLIVGHSHGGNVCLRAFAHLAGLAAGIRVATLATPFVEAVEGRADRFASLLVVFVAALALGLRLGQWLLGGEPTAFLLLLGAAALIGFVSLVAFALAVDRRFNALIRRIAEGSSQAAFRAARAPTLVLRGFDDEASLTLGLGAVAARLSHLSTALALTVADWARQIVFLGLLASGTIAWFAVAGERMRTFLLEHMLVAGEAYGPRVVAVVGALALIEGLAPGVFGRELFGTYLRLEINSNSAPDAGEHVRTVSLAPAAAEAGLRHALYAHPDCAAQIADWLAETARAPSTPPRAPL